VQAAQPSGPVDPHEYRHAMARFATGVAVVATELDGVRYGKTVSSLASVSLDPVLLLFSCERDASLHEPVLASGRWAVSVLSAEQEDVARWFATRGVRGIDQFQGQSARPGAVTGAPLLEGALAWFECRTWASYDGGDHTILVGEVVNLDCAPDAAALLYHRSRFGRLDI
jgi:flavin reductase (DIM6/NTAB) family NADH-FMN oxidoreductase RutF